MPLRPPALLCLCLFMGGGVNVLLDVSHSHLTVLSFQIFQSRIFPPSKEWPTFMERYRSAIDILRIAVIPDHRFLWCACSLCLFLSACPNVSVDLQQSDSAVVPLPSPCGRVVCQVALAPSLINQSV